MIGDVLVTHSCICIYTFGIGGHHILQVVFLTSPTGDEVSHQCSLCKVASGHVVTSFSSRAEKIGHASTSCILVREMSGSDAAAASAATAHSATTSVPAALSDGSKRDDILGNIKKLKDQALQLKTQKAAVQKQLKNEEKRRRRLKQRAKQLSDQDLLALLKMRETSGPSEGDDAAAPSSSSGECGPSEGLSSASSSSSS